MESKAYKTVRVSNTRVSRSSDAVQAMKLIVVGILVLFSCQQVFCVEVEMENNGTSSDGKVADPQDDEEATENPISVDEDKNPDGSEPTGPNSYMYKYVVRNRNANLFFDKAEMSEDGKVNGSYSVLMPNGLVQTVQYFANKESGFVPRISYKDQGNVLEGDSRDKR